MSPPGILVTGQEGHYMYTGQRVFSSAVDPVYDVRALTDGHISISLCTINMLDTARYQKMNQRNITLNKLY